jgi:hypothetical protein
MSHGFGKCERRILAELASRECFWLLELLPRHPRKAAYNAMSRAAWRLCERGLIELYRYLPGSSHAGVLCARMGMGTPSRRPEFKGPLSGGAVSACHQSHTYRVVEG